MHCDQFFVRKSAQKHIAQNLIKLQRHEKLILTAAAILLTVTTAIVVRQAIRHNARTMSLVDMNIEAPVQIEGGVQTKACYLEFNNGAGNQGHKQFCDRETDSNGNGMIYKCPVPTFGSYSDFAIDRCLP